MRDQNVDGRVPDRELPGWSLTSRYASDTNALIEEGIEPVKLLQHNDKLVKVVRDVKTVGKVPEKTLLEMSRLLFRHQICGQH